MGGGSPDLLVLPGDHQRVEAVQEPDRPFAGCRRRRGQGFGVIRSQEGGLSVYLDIDDPLAGGRDPLPGVRYRGAEPTREISGVAGP